MCAGVRALTLSADAMFSGGPLPPTLEALEMCMDSTPLCAHIISVAILPQLQSLEIRLEFPPAEILEQLAQLRTLVVEQLPWKPAALPPSLRHFALHPCAAEYGEPVEFLVEALCALPELRLVTVTRRVAQHVRAALERTCRDKRVDFGTYKAPWHFQSWEGRAWTTGRIGGKSRGVWRCRTKLRLSYR
ncbi:hypothetical protein FA95DRAFT_1572952 [Auriscalpium vulgare]|uniref:Uncharacterized protein n=1 Tax=Auriscalpium vulgare TaxID=40419 RepID=A0ACB8RRX5_9AGAM|nr:hypothetical protein FA95DRAFT_1572952 [Auriscalpium vulgare]